MEVKVVGVVELFPFCFASLWGSHFVMQSPGIQ